MDGRLRPRVLVFTAAAVLCDAGEVQRIGAAEPPSGRISFLNDVQPVLTKAGCNSGACHGAMAGKNGFRLSLRGFDHQGDHAVLTRQAGARRVSCSAPDESLMLEKALGKIPHGGGKRFDEGSPEHGIIRGWIEQGAPALLEGEPALESIAIEPPGASLEPGATLALKVTARYSGGPERDVTRWIKYGTTQDAVATVDEAGVVTVLGPGEAAITAWFQSKVAFARISSPFSAAVPPDVYTTAARRNFIDDLVLEKLQELRIAPSALASDTELIRRVYLDAAGVLPAAKETLRFAADAGAGKREELIEQVLSRPELVDYWTYKWSDLLLLNSRKISGDSLVAFFEFIRTSVAENKPWDRFVREIIAASGSTFQNGAAGYYLIHKDPIDLTETTSQAFLGLSLTCARCHNHPLEKWTQDQYYGMANLFARVKLKDGDRPGEVLVHSTSFGEVLHPRTGRVLEPRPLDARPVGLESPVDRRVHLAEWLTSSENPFFARTVVNRVWKNFFGRGLVEPEDDLRSMNPPSNEPLLAALVKDFVAHRFDMKHLMRTILLSATYQRSSRPHLGNERDEVFYSRYIVRRLPAEVVLDAYSSVTGVPTPFPGYPDGFRALQLRDSQVTSYFLKTFGRPDRNTTCACERVASSSLTQVLHLANGPTLDEKLRARSNILSRLIERQLPEDEILDELYLTALSRFPSPKEQTDSLRILAEARVQEGDKPETRRAALEDLLWGILSGKEFLFNK